MIGYSFVDMLTSLVSQSNLLITPRNSVGRFKDAFLEIPSPTRNAYIDCIHVVCADLHSLETEVRKSLAPMMSSTTHDDKMY